MLINSGRSTSESEYVFELYPPKKLELESKTNSLHPPKRSAVILHRIVFWIRLPVRPFARVSARAPTHPTRLSPSAIPNTTFTDSLLRWCCCIGAIVHEPLLLWPKKQALHSVATARYAKTELDNI